MKKERKIYKTPCLEPLAASTERACLTSSVHNVNGPDMGVDTILDENFWS